MAENVVRRRRAGIRSKRRTLHFFDYNLVFLVIFLVVIGLIMIFSATAYSSTETNFFLKQVIFAVIGIAAMIGVSFIPYQFYRGVSEYVVVITAILILLVKTPLGYTSHGATRWLQFGSLTVQPAEIAKIAIILFTAMVISRVGKQIRSRNGVIMIFGGAAILSGLLLVITSNLSSAIIVFAIPFLMYFIAHPKMKPFIIMAVAVIIFAVLLVVAVEMFGSSSGGFRLVRILAWLHPEDYADSKSYQTLESLYAIGSGGLFGKGLGSSAVKLVMPEAQNDMIFAIICEELGLFGAMVIILLFILLLYRIVYIARNVDDIFASMLAIGVFCHIAVQVVLNIAVVTNSMPNTGISLPFISAGGSSLVFLMVEIGIVLNVSKSIPYE